MKLIEALKKQKDLLIKADDLKKKVATYCSDQSHETAVYGDAQKDKIKEWLQAYSDIVKEILHLKILVQRTNLLTNVDIEFDGKVVTKTIAEWVIRRRELAALDLAIWSCLGDKNLREGTITTSTGEKQEIKIRRYFDPVERDAKVELYRSEPFVIDRTLEVVNCVTDVVEV